MAGMWLRAAPTLSFQDVTALAVFDNGSGDQLYGMTYKLPDKGGCLFRYNDIDAWDQVAPYLLPYYLTSLGKGLVEFNSKLYGSTSHTFQGSSFRLLEWNGVDAWGVVATPYSLGLTAMGDLIVFDDGGGDALFGSTASAYAGSGRLLKWNGVDTLNTVAPAYLNQRYCYDLCEYGGELYGGMGASGFLFKWNGVDAWTKVADQLNGQTSIISLAVYDNGGGDALYGGTSPNGKLFRFNDVDAWEEVADQLNGQTKIYSLLVSNGKLHGGTGTGGRLFQWNDTDAWEELAPKLSASHILDLAEYGGEIFGATPWNGSLYKYIPPAGVQMTATAAISTAATGVLGITREDHRFVTAVNDRIYQQFF